MTKLNLVTDNSAVIKAGIAYGDVGLDLERPVAGIPPRPPVVGDLIAVKHTATGKWLGPDEIVEIEGQTLIAGVPQFRAVNGVLVIPSYKPANGGHVVISNGYGDGFNQWRYADEVAIWYPSDEIILELLRSRLVSLEDRRRIYDWLKQ